MTGRIPTEFGNFPFIDYLSLVYNWLTGPIPDSLSNLETLKTLVLGGNALTSTIPSSLTLLDLEAIHLFGNYLTGTLPEFMERAGVRTITISRNMLTGPVPESIFELRNLGSLVLFSNKLDGTLSTKIGQLAQLTRLHLQFNEISGTLPTELGKLRDVTDLFLESNQFMGPIPSDLGRMDRLLRLTLSSNQLTGSIPSSLGDCNVLQELKLHENNLAGLIPLGLLALTDVASVMLHNNSLTGSMLFCNESAFPAPLPILSLTADCGELECPCCTDCCSDATGACIIELEQICQNHAKEAEYNTNIGTDCACFDKGATLSCADQECQICRLEVGDEGHDPSCLENFDWGIDYQEDGWDNLRRCNMRFISGRNADTEVSYHVDAGSFECSMTVDGVPCNSCDSQLCSDGFWGTSIDCSNIEEGAVYDDCDGSLNGGDLLWFLAPAYSGSECQPCTSKVLS